MVAALRVSVNSSSRFDSAVVMSLLAGHVTIIVAIAAVADDQSLSQPCLGAESWRSGPCSRQAVCLGFTPIMIRCSHRICATNATTPNPQPRSPNRTVTTIIGALSLRDSLIPCSVLTIDYCLILLLPRFTLLLPSTSFRDV
jgi:hypothetical protein